MEVRKSGFLLTIPLLITIFSISLPVYAQYSGGSGEPNDPYQIATAEDLMLLGDSPEDYDKHFILTADIVFTNPSDASPTSFGILLDAKGVQRCLRRH